MCDFTEVVAEGACLDIIVDRSDGTATLPVSEMERSTGKWIMVTISLCT
ncbi:hypothetical protein [Streptomyces sp. NPDC002559]